MLQGCEKLCEATEGCTHFSWSHSGGGKGLCGLKAGNASKEDAFFIEEKNTLCGVIDAHRVIIAGEVFNSTNFCLILSSL